MLKENTAFYDLLKSHYDNDTEPFKSRTTYEIVEISDSVKGQRVCLFAYAMVWAFCEVMETGDTRYLRSPDVKGGRSLYRELYQGKNFNNLETSWCNERDCWVYGPRGQNKFKAPYEMREEYLWRGWWGQVNTTNGDNNWLFDVPNNVDYVLSPDFQGRCSNFKDYTPENLPFKTKEHRFHNKFWELPKVGDLVSVRTGWDDKSQGLVIDTWTFTYDDSDDEETRPIIQMISGPLQGKRITWGNATAYQEPPIGPIDGGKRESL